MRRRGWAFGIAIVMAATPVVAASGVVRTMKIWKSASKPVDAMLDGGAPYSDATARAALQAYVEGAGKIVAGLHGTTAEAKDYRGRFIAFQADAQAANAVAGQPPAFKAAYTRLMGECSSCHDQYKD